MRESTVTASARRHRHHHPPNATTTPTPPYHQPVVHAHFTETDSDRVDVLLVDPRLEQLDGEGCRHACTHTHTHRGEGEGAPWPRPPPHPPSLTRFSLKRLLRMEADRFPLASRMPVSMASLLRSDSVKPFRNSSNWTQTRATNAVKVPPRRPPRRPRPTDAHLLDLVLEPLLQVLVTPDQLVKNL